MGNYSKPWLNYKSDAPEREYPKHVRKKRSFKWALFWLIVGGHWGAHRLYLWDSKKAVMLFIFTILSLIIFSILLVTMLGFNEDNAVDFAPFIPWFLIIIFELPKLKQRVEFKNKKHLL